MSDKFQDAYRRARRNAGQSWPLLSNREQTEAVSRELRALDSEPPTEADDVTEDASDALASGIW